MAGILEDNARGWKIVQKNEQLTEKRNFEGNCKILKPESQKGIYLFYHPPIIFYNAIYRHSDNYGVTAVD